MRSNIDSRSTSVAQHEDVERTELDYNDGEIVIMALCDKVDDDFEEFIENLGLTILSGPKYVGLGIEVVLE